MRCRRRAHRGRAHGRRVLGGGDVRPWRRLRAAGAAHARAVEEDGTPCAQALAEAGLAPAGAGGSVTVAGHSAQVRYADDTVFLARFDDGWRVTAAGCERVSSDDAVPYDCVVDGG